MTGFHIKAGYSSVYSREEIDKAIADEVAFLKSGDGAEAIRAEADGMVDKVKAEFEEVVRRYAVGEDLLLVARANEVVLLASGGGMYRDAKEAAHRAFIRVMMRRMHERGMDISVVVA